MNTTANDKGVKNADTATTTDKVTEVPEDTFSRSDFNFEFSKVKAEVTTILQDASKRRPLYSKDVATARAKRASVQDALNAFIEAVDAAKRDA
jgi:hypothetical protein